MRYFFLRAFSSNQPLEMKDVKEADFLSGYFMTEQTYEDAFSVFTVDEDGYTAEITIFSENYAEITYSVFYGGLERIFSKTSQFKQVKEDELLDVKVKREDFYIHIENVFDDDGIELYEKLKGQFPDIKILKHESIYQRGAGNSVFELLINLKDLVIDARSLYAAYEAFKAILSKVTKLDEFNALDKSVDSISRVEIQGDNINAQIEKHISEKFNTDKFYYLGCSLNNENLLICEYKDAEKPFEYIVIFDITSKLIVDSSIISVPPEKSNSVG